jgi:hypothetical protein
LHFEIVILFDPGYKGTCLGCVCSFIYERGSEEERFRSAKRGERGRREEGEVGREKREKEARKGEERRGVPL